MAVQEINNITIEKGTDFEVIFNLFEPDNSAVILSGLTTTYASIRKYSEDPAGEEFRKTITAANGTIKLSLTGEQTSRLKAGRNYFDVILTFDNKKTKVIKGTIIVSESVSL